MKESLTSRNRRTADTIRAHHSDYLIMSITLAARPVLDTIVQRGCCAAAAAEPGKVPSALTHAPTRRAESQ